MEGSSDLLIRILKMLVKEIVRSEAKYHRHEAIIYKHQVCFAIIYATITSSGYIQSGLQEVPNL